MIGNKIANKITKASKISPEHSSGTVLNEIENIELDREIPKERYLFIGLKLMMTHVEHITPVVKLNLKLRC